MKQQPGLPDGRLALWRSATPWIDKWCARGLCIPCDICYVMTPRLHIVTIGEGKSASRRCRRCKSERAGTPRRELQKLPAVLQNLRYPERLLVAPVQVTQMLFELPSGKMAGQYGRQLTHLDS